MSQSEKAVFLKQSGESLNQGNQAGTASWTEKGIQAVTQNIVKAYESRQELGVSGITIIPGAGNIARGKEISHIGINKYADSIGRIGTVQNLLVIAESLEAAGVPTEVMMAAKMRFWDKNISPSAYNVQKLKEAHQEGKVVIIGGGTGEDGVTTDNAVVFYAQDYREVYDGEIMVLKSTKYDGVYQGDPAKAKANGSLELPRYKKISAQQMLKDYAQFSVVDRASLQRLIDSGLTMHIYQEGKHSLLDVLRHQPTDLGATIGTLVVSETCEAVLY